MTTRGFNTDVFCASPYFLVGNKVLQFDVQNGT